MTIDKAWRRLTAERSGWFWMAGALRNGDLYHVCSLAAAFADHFGRNHPIYLVVAWPYQAEVAGLFATEFAEIIIFNEFPPDGASWNSFFAASGLPRFGRDTPMLVHPNFYDWGQTSIEIAAQTNRTWMDIYKRILNLPVMVEPSFPQLDLSRKERARALCEAAGMPQGRAVILFPYAQSLPMPATAYFAELARDLRRDGFAVYTSVANAELPIEQTESIFIPFGLLIEVAEYCGWVVAIRSGICDIVSSARCRRTFVYPSFYTIVTWSVGAMDLARDAQEVAFPFTGDPHQFSALVRSGRNSSPMALPPRRVSSLLNSPAGEGMRTIAFSACSDGALARACADLESGTLAAVVVHDVPNRAHPRRNLEIAAVVERFVDDEFEVYACRDASPSGYLERVTGALLQSGNYVAALNWHSLVVLAQRGATIDDWLPAHAREALLIPVEKLKLNEPIVFGSFFGSAEHVAATSQGRALFIKGLQFLEGWSGLERWGLWSEGLSPSLNLFADRPLQPGVTLHLEANGCVSPSFPRININFTAEGRDAGQGAIITPFHNVFDVALGEICEGAEAVTIAFHLDEARSPEEQSGQPDGRKLGIGLVTAELRYADPLVAG